MRKKLLLILLSFSLVFLFLTISQVYGEVWNDAETWTFNLNSISIGSWRNIETWSFNVVDLADWKNVETWTFNLGEGWHNAQTKQWDYLVTQSSQIIDLLLVFTIVTLFVVFGYVYWFRIRNPKKV